MITRAVTCAIGFGLTFSVCAKGPMVSERLELAPSQAATTAKAAKPLSEIDLSQIGHVAPKGRVQDKDYNDLVLIDQLLANGKDAIPFLISKLEDDTKINHQVLVCWPGPATVGDVAFVILMNFTTDSSWTRTTVPGADRDSLLGKYDPTLPGVQRLSRFVEEHGRKPIRLKWEKIWAKYKDEIIWDEWQRCFRVRDQFYPPYTIYDNENR